MIEAVLVFGFLSAIFEAIVIQHLKPSWRKRILFNPFWAGVAHGIVIFFNLTVHWGTMTGSMTAIVAGLASFATIPALRYLNGYRRF